MTTSTAPHRQPPETVTELARRLPPDALVVDADDIIAEIEALGVNDRTARERYGMPSVFSLGEAVLTHLRHGHIAGHIAGRGHRGARRAPSPRRYLLTALLRCALYLGPLSVTLAATGPLSRVAWQVPAVTLVLGWSAAQALTGAGGSVARRAGTAAAARLVCGGFAAAIGLWCALVWVAPKAMIGPDRLLAATVGVGGLITLGTVAGALVTRAELAVIRWSLPVWLLAAVTAAGAWPPGVPGHLLLGVAVLAAAARAFRPALRGAAPPRPALSRAELRHALCYLIIGAAQASCVALLWRAGPVGVSPPAVLPLLAAVPMLEALVGWHTGEVDAGLDGAESVEQYARHVTRVTLVTIAGLLPPLTVGLALTAAAYRLPYALSAQEGARILVLSLAGGTLLGGVLAVTLLLAALGRTAVAAGLAAAPPSTAAAVAVLAAEPDRDLLLSIVAILAVTHVFGLLAVAHTALEHRRTS